MDYKNLLPWDYWHTVNGKERSSEYVARLPIKRLAVIDRLKDEVKQMLRKL